MPLVSTSKLLAVILAAGWLAEALAGKNGDIEAGIAAYTSGDHEAALAAYAAAEAEFGERPEIFYNRGLALVAKGDKDEARKAFERGTESTHPDVHSSSEYELGNLDLDAEAFDPAIEHYIKCLKAKPDHANAKWNLELALLKKKQKEEEEKKKQEEEKKDEENKDEEKKDEEKQDEEKKDEQKQDEKKDEEKKDEQKQDEKKDEEKKDEQKQDEQKQDQQKQDQQKQDEQKQEKGEQPQPQPQPQLDKADLDKALEQLDAEDNFQLDRPSRQIRVEKDW
ncbi:tetratricopeptide repeat protein [Nannocystis bainbridge]|uniref:Tetratricopeptide repeat protein n=1 Tax=Nannocystis bainbridge TaxID=2995303 RepID=A0ABT5E4C3_9BACT|nr:tetratricopeptide repeat protein [Nannocystis bainbridge]MDC0720585.1 tetratricopeptide repeat protein [Nannocystis bainbridge]